MCTDSRICGNCAYWLCQSGVDMPNPDPLGRALLPRVRLAPCGNPAVEISDAPQSVAFMTADGRCDQYGDGFAPSLEYLEAARAEAGEERRERDWLRRSARSVPAWEYGGEYGGEPARGLL